MSAAQTLWQANALWAGPLLVERLRDQVPGLRLVQLLDELDPKTNAPRQVPAAVVLLDSMGPVDPQPMRLHAVVQQDWLVALAVRGVGPEADRNSAQIGALIPAVVKALQGWAPGGEQQLRSFAWRPGLRPNYGRDLSYWPLLFSLQVITA